MLCWYAVCWLEVQPRKMSCDQGHIVQLDFKSILLYGVRSKYFAINVCAFSTKSLRLTEGVSYWKGGFLPKETSEGGFGKILHICQKNWQILPIFRCEREVTAFWKCNVMVSLEKVPYINDVLYFQFFKDNINNSIAVC